MSDLLGLNCYEAMRLGRASQCSIKVGLVLLTDSHVLLLTLCVV